MTGVTDLGYQGAHVGRSLPDCLRWSQIHATHGCRGVCTILADRQESRWPRHRAFMQGTENCVAAETSIAVLRPPVLWLLNSSSSRPASKRSLIRQETQGACQKLLNLPPACTCTAVLLKCSYYVKVLPGAGSSASLAGGARVTVQIAFT